MECPKCRGTILASLEEESCLNCGYIPARPTPPRPPSREGQAFRKGLARELGIEVKDEIIEEPQPTDPDAFWGSKRTPPQTLTIKVPKKG